MDTLPKYMRRAQTNAQNADGVSNSVNNSDNTSF